MVSEVFPTDVDTLFTLLFTNSKFYIEFHNSRKTFGKSFEKDEFFHSKFTIAAVAVEIELCL